MEFYDRALSTITNFAIPCRANNGILNYCGSALFNIHFIICKIWQNMIHFIWLYFLIHFNCGSFVRIKFIKIAQIPNISLFFCCIITGKNISIFSISLRMNGLNKDLFYQDKKLFEFVKAPKLEILGFCI